jgi:hypothetical protein
MVRVRHHSRHLDCQLQLGWSRRSLSPFHSSLARDKEVRDRRPGRQGYDFGGTLSACPLVAGICALVLTANPPLTAEDVKNLLKETARKIGDGCVNNHSLNFGYGCVDAESAVRRALSR